MREFNLEEAKKMTHNEVMSVVCDGLAEVCDIMANDAKGTGPRRVHLVADSEAFRALGKVFKANSGRGLDHYL